MRLLQTAQELYNASLTPDGRAHEASRLQLIKATHLERCATAPGAGWKPLQQLAQDQFSGRDGALGTSRSPRVTAATKPQRVNKRNYEYNKSYRSEMRTRIKRVR